VIEEEGSMGLKIKIRSSEPLKLNSYKEKESLKIK